ncbi:MAG TPA: DUF6384 family protein [Microvirga sp.]|nr:DUF6384 family protein [Microvirga sp.]
MPDAAGSSERMGEAAAAPPLDDVMMAMDVVDTLRHREDWVRRELDESGREAALIERLREIYRGQGIAVPDRVLQEGVLALQESRFVYTPPKPGLATTLATIWVSRERIGKALIAVAAVLLLAGAAYYAAVVRPRQENARALAQAHAGVAAVAEAPTARERADRLFAEGRAALAAGDEAKARASLAALEQLRAELPRAYSLRIVAEVSKQVRTALHRRNYYIIVEAVAPDGGILTLPITSEEDGQTRMVNRWGIRVPEDTFIAVERDRRDDGVLQRDRLGEKRRGEPDVSYALPVLGGAITQW